MDMWPTGVSKNHFTAKIPIEMPQNPDWVYFE